MEFYTLFFSILTIETLYTYHIDIIFNHIEIYHKYKKTDFLESTLVKVEYYIPPPPTEGENGKIESDMDLNSQMMKK